MPPKGQKASKPSGFLGKCCITVEGSLGKDAKISDVEKWTVNNGGTYKSKIDKSTTHVICTLDTYQKDDFALPKKYAEYKKLQFVKWDWMDETLRTRRLKPVKGYLHPRDWGNKLDKKTVRRLALLTGSESNTNTTRDGSSNGKETVEEIQAREAEKAKQESAKKAQSEQAKKDKNKTAHDSQVLKKPTAKPTPAFELLTLVDESGVVWTVDIKGSDTANLDEDDCTLSILVTNSTPHYYRAQYLSYSPEHPEPVRRTVSVGSSFDKVRAEFEKFYMLKTGKQWSEYYAQLQATARSERPFSEHSSDVFLDAKSEFTMTPE